MVSQLHYERWKCIRMLGKERPNKLIGGKGVIEVKLTPTVDQGTTARLVPAVGRIEADGALGELLRSGSLGEQLREKIRDSLLHAMQKGTDFKATLPPVAQDYITIEKRTIQRLGRRGLERRSSKVDFRFPTSRSRNYQPGETADCGRLKCRTALIGNLCKFL